MEEEKGARKPSFSELNALMLGTPKEKMELERREVYVEYPAQKLLRKLLEGGKDAEILPIYDPLKGFRYETAESAFEDATPETVKEFLERLSRLEILKKSFYDTVSACPVCESLNITMHYRCPKCNSGNIVKTSLTEHIPCGNIDEKEKYVRDNCPKCGANLVEGQWRDMGLWYICKKCGERFEHPQLDLICRRCNNRFKVETAKVYEISKYSLNPDREAEIKQNVASLESLSKLLTDLGFNVGMPASAIGEKSGIQHHFTILATDGENVVTVDHAVGDPEVQALPLILYIYKISEVKVDVPIFVAIPKIGENARKIAQGYNILLIEGNPQRKEQIEVLKQEIRNRLSEGKTEKAEGIRVSPEGGKTLRAKREPRRYIPGKGLKPQLYTPTPSVHPEPEPKKTLFEKLKKAMQGA